MKTQGILSNHTFTVTALPKVSQWLQACAIENGGKRTESCRTPGLSVEAVSLLSKILGFQYEVLWTNTYDDVEDSVANGTADFSMTYLAALPERWTKYTFMPPMNFLEIGFANRAPKKRVAKMPIFRPFRVNVWFCLVAVFVGLVAVIALAELAPRRAPNIAFELFSFMMNQLGTSVKWRRQRPKGPLMILLVTFAMFLILIDTLYASVLVAYLYPIRQAAPFSDTASLAERVAKGRYKVFARYPLDSLYFKKIFNSSIPGHVLMREALQKNPPKYFMHEGEMPRPLKKDRSLVAPLTSLTFSAYWRKFHKCSVKFIKDTSFIDTWESIVVRKDFPYKTLFHETLSREMHEVLRRIYFRDYYIRYDEPCFELPEKQKPKKLEHLAVIFYFFIAGLGAATFVFLVELHVHVRNRL